MAITTDGSIFDAAGDFFDTAFDTAGDFFDNSIDKISDIVDAASDYKGEKTYGDKVAYTLKNGISRPNRFSVLIPLPEKLLQKADSPETSKNTKKWFDTAVKAIKLFTGDGKHELTRGLDLMCSQTELPGKSINTSEAKYNGDVFKVGQSITYGNQQFAFKVSRDMYEKNIIDQWMNLVVNPANNEIGYLEDYAVNIVVYQLDEQDNIVHSVKLINAFPVMTNPLVLSNHESNTTHELQVGFAYTAWSVVELEESNSNPLYDTLMQTPLGPFLAPIISNPVVQRGLDYFENATGIDLEGEALNIYNQADDILKATTGESINKTAGLLNGMIASVGVNDTITPQQQSKLLDLISGTIGKLGTGE